MVKRNQTSCVTKILTFGVLVAVCMAGVVLATDYHVAGINHYYGIRWQSPKKIKMFQMLNQAIPPDKDLLSFEDFIVNQHSSKGAFYRPEFGWYLDRDIVPARSLAEIKQKAKTGNFPYYLIPRMQHTIPLINQLARKYKYEYLQGHASEKKNDKFYRASMADYLIFNLNSSTSTP